MPEKKFDAVLIYEYSCCMENVNKTASYTRYLISQLGEENDLLALLQWIRNVNSSFARNSLIPWDKHINATNYMRDFQMGENVKWWLDHYKAGKYILWAANYHGAKDISQTSISDKIIRERSGSPYTPSDPLTYHKAPTMGEHILYYLKDRVYSLAMAALPVDSLRAKTIEYKNTLELELFKKSDEKLYSFTNLEPLRYHPAFRGKHFYSVLMYKKYGNWMDIFDGAYYKFEK